MQFRPVGCGTIWQFLECRCFSMPKKRSAPHDEFRAGVPTWPGQVGTRIGQLLDTLGGLEEGHRISGVSTDTLANWRDQKARPAFLPLAALCKAAGRSLDWLATGEDPAPPGAASAELPPKTESAGREAASRMLERHVDLDLLDEAFREALRAARIPEAAVKDPHLLMILTVATYDLRILEQAAARNAENTTEANSEGHVSARD